MKLSPDTVKRIRKSITNADDWMPYFEKADTLAGACSVPYKQGLFDKAQFETIMNIKDHFPEPTPTANGMPATAGMPGQATAPQVPEKPTVLEFKCPGLSDTTFRVERLPKSEKFKTPGLRVVGVGPKWNPQYEAPTLQMAAWKFRVLNSPEFKAILDEML